MKYRKTFLALMFAAPLGLLVLPGCGDDDDLGDAAEEVGDDLEDAADDAGDAIDEGIDDVDDLGDE